MKNIGIVFFLSIMTLYLYGDSTIKAEEITITTLENNASLYSKLTSLDYLQANISHKILVFSSNLDYNLAHLFTKEHEDEKKELDRSIKQAPEAYGFYALVSIYDDFFKNENYLSSANNSYVLIRGGAIQNAEQGVSYVNNIRVNLRLPLTEKKLYFFIGDEQDTKKKTLNNEGESTSIGIKYFIKPFEVLNTSVFGGFRGVTNPFVKLRMDYPMVYDRILFRPVQYFEYSLEDEFKEETQFYFDHLLANKTDLLSLVLSRSTETNVNGMNYFGQLAVLSTAKHGVGYQIYTNFSGRTGLNNTLPDNTKYNITPTIGVYDYKTGVIWKQQFFKKYLFYELQPSVQFAQKYDYHANYIFQANLELYFGDI